MAKHIIPQYQFESKYIPEPNSGCWLWVGPTDSVTGYGKCGKIGAHRISWTLHRGEIPPRLCVLHKCDNRVCVNPEHLFLGTQKDNVDDMRQKGRHRIALGESAAGAKLTRECVLFIRRSPLSLRALARVLGVSFVTVHDVRSGKNWSHVRDDLA